MLARRNRQRVNRFCTDIVNERDWLNIQIYFPWVCLCVTLNKHDLRIIIYSYCTQCQRTCVLVWPLFLSLYLIISVWSFWKLVILKEQLPPIICQWKINVNLIEFVQLTSGVWFNTAISAAKCGREGLWKILESGFSYCKLNIVCCQAVDK